MKQIIMFITVGLALLFLLVMPLEMIATPVLPLCQDVVPLPVGNCTMVTPWITGCTNFTYHIVNVSNGQDVVENTSLIQLNQSIYYFNFTQPEGDYILHTCDDTTREVRVRNDEVTYSTGVAILFVSMLGMFGGWVVFMVNRNPSKDALINTLVDGSKWLFFLTAPWIFVLGTALSTQIALDAGANSGVINLLNTAYRVLLWLSYFTTGIIFVILAKILFDWVFKIPNEMKKTFGGRR